MAGFPERLKAGRTGLGLTQKQLAFELTLPARRRKSLLEMID